MIFKTIEQTIGNTPLVKLQRLNPNSSNTILLKLEVITLQDQLKIDLYLTWFQIVKTR